MVCASSILLSTIGRPCSPGDSGSGFRRPFGSGTKAEKKRLKLKETQQAMKLGKSLSNIGKTAGRGKTEGQRKIATQAILKQIRQNW